MKIKERTLSLSLSLQELFWYPLEGFFDRLGVTFLVKDLIHSITMQIKNPVKQQVAFIEDLNEWNKDGSNILDALNEIRQSAIKSGKRNSFNERAAKSLSSALENGKPISDGMQGLFSDELVDLFGIGERTNTMPVLIPEFLSGLEERNALKNQATKKLTYPVFLSLALLSVMVSLSEYGVPALESMGLDLSRLRGGAKRLRSFADGLALVYPYLSVFITGLWMFFVITKNNYTGKVWWLPSRSAMDRIVPYSINKQFVAMNTIKKIAMLSKAGLSLQETVNILSRHSTPYERYFFNQIKTKLGNETGSVAVYLDVDLLNRELYSRLSSLAKQEGEQAKLKAVYVAGERSGKAALAAVRNSIRILVPIAWVVMSILTLLMVLGIIDFSGSIKNLLPTTF